MMRSGPGGAMVSTPWGFELPSVTTIIKATIPKPFAAGAWYGYRMALEGVAKEYGNRGNLSDFGDAEVLEKRLSQGGYNPNQSLELSRGRGIVAHDVLELLAQGQEEIAEGACWIEKAVYDTAYGFAVLDWWEQNKGAKWKPEQPVFSLAHRYAGTADLISATEIVDLKTHNPARGFTKPGQGPAYLSDLIQLRAYRTAWEEMSGQSVTSNRILVARPNGKWLEDTREVPESLWLQCLAMYQELSVHI